MRFGIFTVAFVYAVTFVAAQRTCGSNLSASQIKVAEADFQAKKGLSILSEGATIQAATIQVYWHVIQSGTSRSQGNIPYVLNLCRKEPASSNLFTSDSQIAQQISVMNSDFSSTGLSFVLAGTTRTTNSGWFTSAAPSTSQQTAMKNALRQGDAKTLNIYSVGFSSGAGSGLLGYATFPSSYSRAPKDDGVVILHSSVPGGTAAPFNLGQVRIRLVSSILQRP